MSQYYVEYKAAAPFADVWDAALIMYRTATWPSKHFPWYNYQKLALAAAEGLPCIVCYKDGVLVGALTIGDLDEDPHIPGRGIIVYNTVVHPDHPQATRLLYRFLVELIKRAGGEWYQTTSRIGETEFKSKFRRIHG